MLIEVADHCHTVVTHVLISVSVSHDSKVYAFFDRDLVCTPLLDDLSDPESSLFQHVDCLCAHGVLQNLLGRKFGCQEFTKCVQKFLN